SSLKQTWVGIVWIPRDNIVDLSIFNEGHNLLTKSDRSGNGSRINDRRTPERFEFEGDRCRQSLHHLGLVVSPESKRDPWCQNLSDVFICWRAPPDPLSHFTLSNRVLTGSISFPAGRT